MNRFSLCLCFAVLVFASCKKSAGVYGVHDNAAANNGYTLRNLMDRPVIFDLYTSTGDYDSCRNVFLHDTIPAQSDYQVAAATIEQHDAYVIDWYQDDYLKGNWMNFDGSLLDTTLSIPWFKFDVNHIYSIQAALPENMWRQVLLSVTKPSSTWRAVDARTRMDSASVWQQLNENQKYQEIDLLKTYMSARRYKDSNGSVYEVSGGPYITESNTSLRNMGGGFSNLFSTRPLNNVSDTLWTNIDSIYYAMVKVQ